MLTVAEIYLLKFFYLLTIIFHVYVVTEISTIDDLGKFLAGGQYLCVQGIVIILIVFVGLIIKDTLSRILSLRFHRFRTPS
jgi:hypothetical protein